MHSSDNGIPYNLVSKDLLKQKKNIPPIFFKKFRRNNVIFFHSERNWSPMLAILGHMVITY